MDRNLLLNQLKQDLGIGLLTINCSLKCPHPDVTTHGLDIETRRNLGMEQINKERFAQLRNWFAQREWHISQQRNSRNDSSDYLILAPMIFVSFDIGYHATLRMRLDSIFSKGLLPGSHDRQTDDKRIDCEGNIYVCEKLGVPEDAGNPGSLSAHWWRDHKSKYNRFGDSDWVILEIDLWKLPPHRLYRDIWSESGVIVGDVSVIPPNQDLFRLVYPNQPGR
jgi:hypothetical protein